MIRPLSLLMPVLLLAACGSSPTPQLQADSPAHAECREEARNSTQSRDYSRQVLIGNPTQEDRIRQLQADAERRAYTDCLRRRGLVRGGGVEAVRRPSGLF